MVILSLELVKHMLQPILGSVSSEQALLFMLARGEGYATEIARYFDANLYAIQKQLDKFEMGGILASRTSGRTRIYAFNPRYPFLKELKDLLSKAFEFYPADLKEDLLMVRKRPRRRGKPL